MKLTEKGLKIVQAKDKELYPYLKLIVNIEKGKLKGFLPVYETLEDAVEEFPNSEYVEIKEVGIPKPFSIGQGGDS